jgi:hypothetical protein
MQTKNIKKTLVDAEHCDGCLLRQGFVAVNTPSHHFLVYLNPKIETGLRPRG